MCFVLEFFGFKYFEVLGCLMDCGWWCEFLVVIGKELFVVLILFLEFCVWLVLVVLLCFLFEFFLCFVVCIVFGVDIVVFLVVFVVCILVCVDVCVGDMDCGRL